MKSKLLKKLCQKGRSMINVISITTTGEVVTGMRYGFDYDEYGDLFELGDTAQDVKEKAVSIYLKTNIKAIRSRYKKYSRKYQLTRRERPA